MKRRVNPRTLVSRFPFADTLVILGLEEAWGWLQRFFMVVFALLVAPLWPLIGDRLWGPQWYCSSWWLAPLWPLIGDRLWGPQWYCSS
uniref:Uncharacterized protein n=1 Tax=Meloidogyne incognita TaxID=6306 RepID=A0A914KLQ3_MELIC